ncbi:pyruvate carboxylase [Euzebya tangerina]|uniref:pyruvate carboxylase n=1 Tax=Euzebya tangerina TaxID=591198 RepID=UPI000E31E8EC|nr:pyruvate carboxylase [Euzebya tangerina]
MPTFETVLVANRSEIAIRVMRAATELGKRTVAVFAEEDTLGLHRFKADEAYPIGQERDGRPKLGPIEAYLSVEEIIRVALMSGADAIHPGYGFLSENPELGEACAANGITFIGPSPETMRALGDKVSARRIAERAGVPVVPASAALSEDPDEIAAAAEAVGFPAMLKASWGGGGRGMRPITGPEQLQALVREGRREAEAAFGNGEVYLERLVQRARHVEVQILGDSHGDLMHLYERDCSVQRRRQKVVERAPAPYLDDDQRQELCGLALDLCRRVTYAGAATIEFLMDADTGAFYFIEVNPRVQVEHTVTEEVTGIDIVKAQIRIAEGATLAEATGVPDQAGVHLNGHALQCRITTEDPADNFIPDYGRITAYRGATGFGIRLDGGTAYSGAVITRFYDSLLEKLTAWAPDPEQAIARMQRALAEFRIRGVATNLAFLQNLVSHPAFRDASYTTGFIDNHPELFDFAEPRDRATKLLRYIAEITVNGHPDTAERPAPPVAGPVLMRTFEPVDERQTQPWQTARQIFDRDGAEAVAAWMQQQERLLITDTTMRDAHQSLLATRMRTFDMLGATKAYAETMGGLFSVECWGGATFDVAMRFLQENPWHRLRELHDGMPNLLPQMLLRASNGVGYTNYPDNVVRRFVEQAADSGVGLFRVFDSLNWVDNMHVAMDAVRHSGAICEGTICYTGDVLDPARSKYDLAYYADLAVRLEDAGAHILGLKDMAGLLKPAAATELIGTLREAVSLPIHLHTHDTSGIAGATLLAAADAGVDAVDAAMDSMSGLTSQPNLGSIVAALRNTPRDTGLDSAAIRSISAYWGAVRDQYAAFETPMRAGASEVYLHEMPGGQFTNLKGQARSLGLEDRWEEIAATYAEVNDMFGDIIKVTPSSKVVGDLALFMVSAGLTRQEVEDPDREVAFPESVVDYFRGNLGQPPGGFPPALQAKVLKGESPITTRPGETLAPVDLEATKAWLVEELNGFPVSEEDLCSYLMYPKVFLDYMGRRRDFGPVRVLPTPIFFYGMEPGQAISVELERGKTLHILLSAIGEATAEGERRVFFELNGQPRSVRVNDRQVASTVVVRPTADPDDPSHVAAPVPGVVVSVNVAEGQQVAAGDLLLSIEAMKMETAIHAERAGTVQRLVVSAGEQVSAKDLLVVVAD